MSNVPPPYPQPPRSNGLGVAGFIVSLLAILTLGLLSPVALLLSFLGLFRRPRGFAFAGFVISFIGTAFIVTVLGFFGWGILQVVRFGKPLVATMKSAQNAKARIDAVYSSTGTLPADAAGEAAIAGYVDGWGRPFSYHRLSADGFQLQSAGKDGVMLTGDDIYQTFDAGR